MEIALIIVCLLLVIALAVTVGILWNRVTSVESRMKEPLPTQESKVDMKSITDKVSQINEEYYNGFVTQLGKERLDNKLYTDKRIKHLNEKFFTVLNLDSNK